MTSPDQAQFESHDGDEDDLRSVHVSCKGSQRATERTLLQLRSSRSHVEYQSGSGPGRCRWGPLLA